MRMGHLLIAGSQQIVKCISFPAMSANQPLMTPTTFAGSQESCIQIVDPSAISDGLDVGVPHTQIVYTTGVADGTAIPAGQYVQQVAGDSVVYDQTAPVVVPQATEQNELEIEPIDLEEVQKIQARMPAADPNAPVGSNKNPIRIIQQGNQYITTQDVSDEHLQQIIQVLTNQALISSSGSRPSAIYNRLTNRRIIFRVTRAKRRHEDGNTSSGGEKKPSTNKVTGKNPSPGKSNINRKRRKRISDDEDPDFEPEVPEEEVLPFPLARRTSASNRVSKPPKHLVKDYKHLRLEDLTDKPETSEDDEPSDGGYSDYVNDGGSEEGWSEDAEHKGLRWPCPVCNKVFSSRAGVSRHQSAAHGPNAVRPKGRWANPYLASIRRRAKLKQAVADATDDDLIEFVAPRLSKIVSPWDHLLMRSEGGDPPLPQISQLVLDYFSLVERARSFLCDQLELRPAKKKKRDVNQNASKPLSSENGENDANHDQVTHQGGSEHLETMPNKQASPATSDSEQHPKSKNSISEVTSPSAVESSSESQTVQKDEKIKKNQITSAEVKNGTDKGQTKESGSVEQDEEDDDEDEDEEEEDSNAIIIKIDTAEQSAAMGLACGRYVVREPLREEYLPRRFRSVLASLRARASASPATDTTDNQSKHALVAMETADDDEVGATLRSDNLSTAEDTTNTGAAVANDSEGVTSLNNELILIPEGGLGGPVPEEWLTSGAFLTVLTENGETSDLVMEAATGRLYHRPTGHLVSVSEDANAAASGDGNGNGECGYEDEPVAPSKKKRASKEPGGNKNAEKDTAAEKSSSPASTQKSQQEADAEEAARRQEEILAEMAESGEVIDLNVLFPGVSVTEVSPGVCLVTKPNGARFNVEHGGEGITLETLQTILQMDA
ncbi:unnamed protein product [Calicophoron daubneyi]|uniref:C2H2-type domain-containing protein n=1 Tax=Calicophoron daubneyi TaxID=300641 RepID=A0AAV2TD17_CALDB